jgi:chemotaxis protein MotB
VSDSIYEIRVLGHTAQARADEINSPVADRFLASNRATVVTLYLQEKNIIDPARLLSIGYGQWRPVASNDTPESRAKNRRVELLVTGLDVSSGLGDDIAQYYSMRAGEDASAESATGLSDSGELQTPITTGQEE